MANQTEDYLSLKPLAERFQEAANRITDEELDCIIQSKIEEQIEKQIDFSSFGTAIEEVIENWFEDNENCNFVLDTLRESIEITLMTTEEMNQRILFLIKKDIENVFCLIKSPEDYEKYRFNAWQVLAEISGIFVALNEFKENKKDFYKSLVAETETEAQVRKRQINDIAAAIKRYNSMLSTSDGRRIDKCKTVNDEYIYEFVR